MKTGINFANKNMSNEQVKNLYSAIQYERVDMEISYLNATIKGLENKIKNGGTTKDVEKWEQDKKEAKEELAKCEKSLAELKAIHELVLGEMTVPNDKGFANSELAIRNVFRVVASADTNLVKYAFIDNKNTIFSEELMKAMDYVADIKGERIEDFGRVVQGKEYKNQLKKAEYEVEKIMREMFSIPIETPYTTVLRVKPTKQDMHLLHSCYVTNFKNEMKVIETTEGEEMRYSNRKIITLITKVKNKKTNNVTGNFAKFATKLVDLVVPYMVKHA